MNPEPPDRADVVFRISSASANGGSCVQVGRHGGRFYLADSTDPHGRMIPVAPGDYTTFITALRTPRAASRPLTG